MHFQSSNFPIYVENTKIRGKERAEFEILQKHTKPLL